MTNPSPPDPTLVGRTWVFPDGRTLPLVQGGSGEFEGYFPTITNEMIDAIERGEPFDGLPEPGPLARDSDDADDEPLDLDDGSDLSEKPAEEPSDEADEADEDDDTSTTLDPAERARLRAEAAAHRTKARALEDELAVFGEGEDREVWVNIARQWADDPVEAARWMQRIAANVLGDEAPAEPKAEPAKAKPDIVDEPSLDDIDDDMPLTKAEVARLVANELARREAEAAKAREEQTKLSREQEAIRKALVEGEIDPDGDDARWVVTWSLANKKPITAGIAAFHQWQTGKLAKFTSGKKADADEVVTAPARGTPAEQALEFETGEEYFAAGTKWLTQQLASKPGR